MFSLYKNYDIYEIYGYDILEELDNSNSKNNIQQKDTLELDRCVLCLDDIPISYGKNKEAEIVEQQLGPIDNMTRYNYSNNIFIHNCYCRPNLHNHCFLKLHNHRDQCIICKVYIPKIVTRYRAFWNKLFYYVHHIRVIYYIQLSFNVIIFFYLTFYIMNLPIK